MGNPLVMTTMCTCTFGMIPSPLMVSSNQTVTMCKMMAATIMDNKFPTFGMCTSLANPTVAAATAAALGVLTPMPCVPLTVAPWAPGCPTVMVNKKPLLNNTSKLICGYGGVIQPLATPAMMVKTP